MALQTPFRIGFEDVFAHGAFAVGDVQAVEDFDKPAGTDRQARDKHTGERVWAIRVVDPDPEARRGQAEVAVKVSADVQPVLPEAMPGLPFRPVEFDGLTVTPYVDERGNRPRVAYSLRAKSVRAPATADKSAPAKSSAASRLPGSAAA